MKNIKYEISFLSQRKKILYVIMDCVEDGTWYRVNQNLSSLVRETNLPVCKDVVNKVKKQIE
jgi:hypothetical protein